MTRREFLTILTRALPYLDITELYHSWSDIPPTEPRTYALFARKYGLIDDIETLFKPDEILTRSAAADIVIRYLQSQ